MVVSKPDQSIRSRTLTTLTHDDKRALQVSALLTEKLPMLRRCNVMGAYTMLVVAAASQTNLRKLHDTVLPENTRLLYKDLDLLVEVWKAVHGTNRPIAVQSLPTPVMQSLVNAALAHRRNPVLNSLEDYYLGILQQQLTGRHWQLVTTEADGLVQQFSFQVTAELAQQEKLFQINLAGLLFQHETIMHVQPGWLEIWFRSFSRFLTAKRTAHLLNLPGVSRDLYTRPYNENAGRVTIGWQLPIEPFLELPAPKDTAKTCPTYIQAFAERLTSGLRKAGVPLSDDVCWRPKFKRYEDALAQ